MEKAITNSIRDWKNLVLFERDYTFLWQTVYNCANISIFVFRRVNEGFCLRRYSGAFICSSGVFIIMVLWQSVTNDFININLHQYVNQKRFCWERNLSWTILHFHLNTGWQHIQYLPLRISRRISGQHIWEVSLWSNTHCNGCWLVCRFHQLYQPFSFFHIRKELNGEQRTE